MLVMDFINLMDGGKYEFCQGSIFKLPPDLGGEGKLKAYSELRRVGRHNIDNGYIALVCRGLDGKLICIPGLLPEGFKKNKFHVNAALKVDVVEKYISATLKSFDEHKNKLRDNSLLFMHDLRGISATIYNAAEEAKTSSESGSVPSYLLDNIVSSQQLLKLRLDAMEFLPENIDKEECTEVYVFRKIDKVCRSFMPMASRKKIQIKLNGSSFSTSNFIEGFEFVPFLIIDNAVKYSPNNTSVDVTVSESENRIFFSVSSIGPNINRDELNLIFDRSYRGQAAKDLGYPGTGLGLYMCRRLVETFKGTITASVGNDDISTSKGILRQVEFNITLPIYSKKYF